MSGAGGSLLARWVNGYGPAVATGILLIAAFPPFDLGLAGWIALVPLLLSLLSASPARGIALGAIGGAVFFAGLIDWILLVLFRFSGMPALLCPLPWLLLVAYLTLYPAAFGGAVAALARRHGETTALVAAPVVWTGLEWLRGVLLTGFPWGPLGASQQGVLPSLQMASLAGVYGLTFLLAAFSAGAAAGLQFGLADRRGRVGLVTAFAVATLTAGWGWWRLSERIPETPSIEVACVQGLSPPDAPESEGPKILATYEDLTRQAVRAGARLVVWAESSTPYGFEMDASYRGFVQDLSRSSGAAIVLGSVGGPAQGPYSNAAFLVQPAGGSAVPYRKIHLVPYGEYVPLGRLMPFVQRFVAAIGEFEPGERPVVWETEGVRLSPLICYEAIFPPLARRAAGAGGEVLLNLTNDGWFGRSAGPAQHLALARFRAVETARPLVRAAETGISAVFDTRGRQLAMGGLQRREFVVARVAAGRETTPFARTGDVLPACCAILTAVLVVPLLPRRRAARGAEPPPAATEGGPPEA